MNEALQIFGAVLILIAFVLTQRRIVEPTAYSSLVLNLVGSAILAVLAAQGEQWGFLLLEGVWALVSAWGLIGRLLARTTQAS